MSEGKRRRGQQRMRWLDSITDPLEMEIEIGKRELVKSLEKQYHIRYSDGVFPKTSAGLGNLHLCIQDPLCPLFLPSKNVKCTG